MRRLGLLLLLTLACSATVVPTATPPAPLATPTATEAPVDTGWQPAGAGLETRRLRVEGDTGNADRLWLLRLDAAAQARLAVVYSPARPLRVSEWSQSLAGGVQCVINAGYFTEDYQATGLLVSDGTAYGTSFAGAGGMLAVSGGRAHVRWLREQPVLPGETFDQAVQGWPMLLSPGGVSAYTEPGAQAARRTAVGADRAGRIVFVVSPTPVFTLHGLADWLGASDLDLDTAVNLDGGQSTGLWLAGGEPGAQVDSFGKIPAVIVLEAED